MFHERLLMSKNKRMSLRDIDSFELKPVARLQMILGSNGSGKSTVLDALSLQPALPAHYHRGGIQEHTVTHRGSTYELSYDFTGVKNHYSISKDGEVVYSGHVASACTQYVEEHLGLSREFHEMCTGRKRFTKMSTSERRAWFTKMSPTDYTYAIGYYARLGDAHRDLTGSIKRLTDRYLKEKEKAVDDIRAEQIRASIAKLKSDKDELLKQWTPVSKSFEDVMVDIDTTDKAIHELYTAFFRSLGILGDRGEYKSVIDVRREEAVLRGKLSYAQAASDKLYETIEANRGEIAKSQYLANQDLELTVAAIGTYRKQITELRGLILYDGYIDPAASLSALNAIWHDLNKTISQFLPDPDKQLSQASFDLRVNRYNSRTLEINNLNIEIEKLQDSIHRFEHREDHNLVDCPKCQHRFDPMADENNINATRRKLESLLEQHTKITEKQEEEKKLIDQETEQLALYRYFFMLVNGNRDALAPVWEVLLHDQAVKTCPGKCSMILERMLSDLRDLNEIKNIEAKIRELDAIRELSEKSAGVNLQELQIKNAAAERELFEHQSESKILKAKIERLEIIQREWEFQDSAAASLEHMSASREHYVRLAEEVNRKTVIVSILSHLDSEILAQEKIISQVDSQKAIIASLEADIADYEARVKLLKKALDALSPKKGLIAKGLTGFINHFVEQMNAVIAKVWLYPLKISAVEIKDTTGALDLDYNFTYTYDDNPGADDVRDASGAQREIFDLAFMLVAMKNMGMDDYPIFLDEFSINMDYAHRKEAMRMVVDLLNNSNFSQIFMVSHYEGSYGSLSNADITVLCPENIEMPTGLVYNNRTTIVHA